MAIIKIWAQEITGHNDDGDRILGEAKLISLDGAGYIWDDNNVEKRFCRSAKINSQVYARLKSYPEQKPTSVVNVTVVASGTVYSRWEPKHKFFGSTKKPTKPGKGYSVDLYYAMMDRTPIDAETFFNRVGDSSVNAALRFMDSKSKACYSSAQECLDNENIGNYYETKLNSQPCVMWQRHGYDLMFVM